MDKPFPTTEQQEQIKRSAKAHAALAQQDYQAPKGVVHTGDTTEMFADRLLTMLQSYESSPEIPATGRYEFCHVATVENVIFDDIEEQFSSVYVGDSLFEATSSLGWLVVPANHPGAQPALITIPEEQS